VAGEETRIIKIEIDQTQALKDLEKTESALLDLKNEQKALNDSLKDGTITQQEYVASKVQLDKKIQEETANRKTLTGAITAESNSLNAQKQRLKELIIERNKIDRSTVDGAKKFDEMNKSVKSLNGAIKSAEEQGGSFQRNVGNYKGAIDNFTGGAYSAVQGIVAMTRASLAFIATPIGAIIAAIGLAVAALTAYFKGSEEGQDNLNKIMTVGGVIMERLTDILEGLGKFLFDAFSNPKEAMIDLFNFLKDNLINRFTAFAVIVEGITNLDFKQVANGVIQAGTGIENVVDKVIDIGKEAANTIDQAIIDGAALADMNALHDKQEREMLEETAKRKLEISILRRQADEAEGQQKLDFINQALALEKLNADAQLAAAQLTRDIAAEELRLNGDTKDAKDKLAKAEADLFNAQTAYFEDTRKMNKERITLEGQIDEALQKQLLAEIELKNKTRELREDEKADLAEKHQALVDNTTATVQLSTDAATAMAATAAQLSQQTQQASDESRAKFEADEAAKREAALRTQEDIIAAVMAGGDVISDIAGKATATRLHELAIELQEVKLKEQEELKALQNKLDAGEISQEDFEAAKLEIEKRAKRDEDAIKKQAFDADKKNRIAQSIIDTIQSGIAAFRSLVGVPFIGPILAAAASAAALVFGYRNVDLIRQEQYVPGGFAIGGYTGPGGKNDPAGIVHRGEVVWNQSDVAAVGGPHIANSMRPTYKGYTDGGIVANAATSRIDQQFMNAGMMPDVFLNMTEMNAYNNKLSVKVKLVEA